MLAFPNGCVVNKVGQVKLEAELKGESKALETAVQEIGKRLDNQEFINRSVYCRFCLSVLASQGHEVNAAGVVKLFFPNILAN